LSLRIAIIGRSELLYNVAVLLIEKGYEIPLIVTSKEAPEYRVTSEDFKNLALKANALFIHTTKINKPDVINQISALKKIDVAVSINYAGIIEQEIIDLFEIGVLNAHGGDLPRYRGNACQAWAMINGEEKIGLCIHKMIGGELDSGDIIKRSFFSININTLIGEVWHWMSESIPEMMLEAVNQLTDNKFFILEAQSKNPEDALRCYPRNIGDGKINWESKNVDILRLINASSEPYSGAFSYLDKTKVILWRAKLELLNENYLAVPGQVSSLNKDGSVTLICGVGKIIITEIQVDDVRTKNVTSIIKSIRNRLK
jgi:UDP-4-amino-4-deoxy-L-arabinose formyltransferase/UDP-glucuronic acid dehydrogenase (UDP-4-keto-hexauronic acid decarboxylating)